jgi:hypothetical protein
VLGKDELHGKDELQKDKSCLNSGYYFTVSQFVAVNEKIWQVLIFTTIYIYSI